MESLIVGSWLSAPEMAHDEAGWSESSRWHPWMESLRFQSSRAESGINVNEDVAYSHPPILDALLLIGGDCTLFLDLIRQQGDSQVSDRNHDAFRLVSRAPNPLICPDIFWELMVQRAMVHGNAIAKITRTPQGRPLTSRDGGGMEPLPPASTRAEHTDDGKLWITTRRGPNSEKEFIDPRDTLHIRSVTTDGWWGRGVLRDGRDRIGNGVALTKHSSSTFANSAKPDFMFAFPGRVGPEALGEFRTELRRKNKGVMNRGESLIVDNGMVATQLGMSLEDAQFKELVELDTVQVAQHFGIPPSMLGVTGQMTFSNTEEQNRWYNGRTLRRWHGRITNESAAKLLSPAEREVYFFRHDLESLLQGSFKDRMEANAKGVSSLILSPNEARRKIGLNPREGGDEFVNPNTTKGDPPSGPPQPPDNRAVAAQLAKALSNEDANLVRAATDKNFVSWIDSYYSLVNGHLRNELSQLVPTVADEYCMNRYQWWMGVAGAVTTKQSLADLIKAQQHTVGDRVAGLLNQEFLK